MSCIPLHAQHIALLLTSFWLISLPILTHWGKIHNSYLCTILYLFQKLELTIYVWKMYLPVFVIKRVFQSLSIVVQHFVEVISYSFSTAANADIIVWKILRNYTQPFICNVSFYDKLTIFLYKVKLLFSSDNVGLFFGYKRWIGITIHRFVPFKGFLVHYPVLLHYTLLSM